MIFGMVTENMDAKQRRQFLEQYKQAANGGSARGREGDYARSQRLAANVARMG